MAIAAKTQDVATGSRTATGTTLVITLGVGKTTTVGHTLILEAAASAAGTLTGVTDTKGNTWTVDGQVVNGSTGKVAVASTILTTALSAGDTITLTWNATCFSAATVSEWPDKLVVDVVSPGATGTATAATTGSSGTLNVADELIINAWMTQNASTYTAGSGYTTLPTAASTGTTVRAIRSQYKVVSATTAQNGAATLTGSAWAGLLVAYKTYVPPPSAPTGLAATPGNTQNVLTWNESTGATGYRLWRVELFDDFNRANSTGLGTAWSGTGFTKSLNVVSNQAQSPTGDAGDLSVVTAGPDSAVLMTNVSFSGSGTNTMFIRYSQTSGGNGYLADFFSDSATIYKVVNGTVTSISATEGYDGADGDDFKFTAIGDLISLYHRPPGGAWTLIVEDTSVAQNSAGAGGMQTSDGGGVIDNVYLQTLIYDSASLAYKDSFDRANATLNTGDWATLAWDGAPLSIISNQAGSSSAGFHGSYLTLAQPTDAFAVDVTMSETGSGEGSVQLLVDGSDATPDGYSIAWQDNGNLNIYRVDAGSTTQIATTAVLSVPGTIRVVRDGSAINVYQQVGGLSTFVMGAVSATYAVDTVALGVDGSTIHFDDFAVGSLTSFTDTGLTNGTAYTYQVSAYNDLGESGDSSSVSGTPTTGGSTISGAATIAATSSISAAGLVQRRGNATIAGTSAVTVAGLLTHFGAATIAGVSSLTSGSSVLRPAAATIAATSAVTASGIRVALGAATIPGTSSVTAAAVVLHNANATIPGTSAVTAVATRIVPGAATIPATSAVTAGGTVERRNSASISGTSAVSATAVEILSAAATINGVSSVSADASNVTFVTGSATINATSSVSATAMLVAGGTASSAGTSAVVADGLLTHLGASTIAATSSVTAAGGVILGGISATIAETSSVSAQGLRIALGAATINATSSVTADAGGFILGAVTIDGTSSAAATAGLIRPGAASIAATSSVSVTAAVVLNGSAQIDGVSGVSALPMVTFAATVTILATSSVVAIATVESTTGPIDFVVYTVGNKLFCYPPVAEVRIARATVTSQSVSIQADDQAVAREDKIHLQSSVDKLDLYDEELTIYAH